jgi:pantoate kinase
MHERSIAHVAHETEIRYRTGLGDVTACRGGGMVVRTIAGIDAAVLRYLNYYGPVSAVSFGPIHTPSVLGSAEQMERVASAFPAGVPETMEEFFSLSREFTEKSGLVTPRVSEVLAACDASGVDASMTMLGNGVFAYGEKAVPVLAAFGDVYRMGIARNGPVLVEEA